MAAKKSMSEADKRDAARKEFVAQQKAKGVAPKEANARFYVQTRVKELTAKGVKVDAAKRQELRKNYESGNVKRAGFGVTPAAGKKLDIVKKSTPMPERRGRETASYTGSAKTSRVQSVPDRSSNPQRNQSVPDRLAGAVASNKGKSGISGFVSGVDRTLRAANPIYGSNRDYFGNIVSAASKGKNVSDSARKAVVAKVKQDAMLVPALFAETPVLLAAKGAYETAGRLGVPLPGYKKNKKK